MGVISFELRNRQGDLKPLIFMTWEFLFYTFWLCKCPYFVYFMSEITFSISFIQYVSKAHPHCSMYVVFHPFLWLNNILLSGYTTLFTHPSTEIPPAVNFPTSSRSCEMVSCDFELSLMRLSNFSGVFQNLYIFFGEMSI